MRSQSGVNSRAARRASARCVALSLGLVCLVHAFTAQADEPEPPVEFYPEDRPPSGTGVALVIAGAGTTGVWYGAAVGVSYLFPDAPGAKDLRIPVAGPWIALTNAGCRDSDSDCGTLEVVIRSVLTVVDGIGQAGGVLVMVEGLLLPTGERAKLNDGPKEQRQQARISVVPGQVGASGDAWGLKLFGSF